MDSTSLDVQSCIRLDTQEVDSVNVEFHDGTDITMNIDSQDVRDVVKPEVGMEFETMKEAYDFYNEYALKTGFGIRKESSNRSRKDKDIIVNFQLQCNKVGKKGSKDSTTEAGEKIVRHRTAQVGCTAQLRLCLTERQSWKITLFDDVHTNHELTTLSKTAKYRSHKKLHPEQNVKNLMMQLHGEGLGNATIAHVVNVLDQRGEDIVTPQQVHDHLRVARRNNIGHNCFLIVSHFKQLSSVDPEFYFNFQLDSDYTMRSIFWADERSRTSYLNFSDVIMFDVTYRTNNFSLPFASFTGVNHYRQSTLFGCALLADEMKDTFVWLFEEWRQCMWGKPPGAIITDQDAAIGNAIAKVFPDTVHRYCDWHLDINIKENLNNMSRGGAGIELQQDFDTLRSSVCESEAEEQ